MPRNKGITIAFGRFNPPTVGHQALVQFVHRTALQLKTDALIFPSVTQDPKRNPLPFKEKVRFLRQFFGRLVHISDDPKIHTPFDALAAVSSLGYEDVYVVVGTDRVGQFASFRKYIKPTGRKGGQFIILKNYRVIPIERDPDSDDDVAGMSATKLRGYAASGDFAEFRKGVPTANEGLAKQLYTTVRRYMKIQETFKRPVSTSKKAFMLYGVTPRAARPLREAFAPLHMSDTVPVYDVTGQSYASIASAHRRLERAGYQVTLYVRNDAAPLTEAVVQGLLTFGLITEGLARDVVEVMYKSDIRAAIGVLEHARKKLMEAESAAPQEPKEPSEVDRLKNQQQQQLILTKERQAQELLAAKQRELQKKSRESQEKIVNGEKAKAITR